jgi:hypothetical protein
VGFDGLWDGYSNNGPRGADFTRFSCYFRPYADKSGFAAIGIKIFVAEHVYEQFYTIWGFWQV